MSGSDCCVETPIIPAQKALSSYQHTHTPSIDPWIEAKSLNRSSMACTCGVLRPNILFAALIVCSWWIWSALV